MKILNIKSIVFLALLEVIYCCNYTEKAFSFFVRKAYENLKNGQPTDAYEDAIAIGNIRFFRGLAYYYNKNYNAATVDFEFAADQNCNKDRCFYYIGMIALDKGIYDLACKYLKLAILNGNDEAGKYLPKD